MMIYTQLMLMRWAVDQSKDGNGPAILVYLAAAGAITTIVTTIWSLRRDARRERERIQERADAKQAAIDAEAKRVAEVAALVSREDFDRIVKENRGLTERWKNQAEAAWERMVVLQERVETLEDQLRECLDSCNECRERLAAMEGK